MRKFLTGLFVLLALSSSAYCLSPRSGALFVRVIDTGAGLCCVLCLPNGQFVIFDAGNYEPGPKASTLAAIRELIPDHSPVELLVLSHSDSDHAGCVKDICSIYAVRRVLRPGLSRTTQTWKDAVKAVEFESQDGQCRDLNLAKVDVQPGSTYRFGPVFATMLSGFDTPPVGWEIISESEKYNAGSIVMRFQFGAKSIIICGDAVGRHLDDPNENACIDTERFVLEMGSVLNIHADVMVASHHGADNGSSLPFVKAVNPQFAIFSAGHKYEHPRAAAANRFFKAGLTDAQLFRTDRGDGEGGKEWTEGGTSGATDGAGDDDVDVLIESTGSVTVEYRHP